MADDSVGLHPLLHHRGDKGEFSLTFTFRPAKREGVSLLIGLAGASGSGKTFTAMRLAAGIAGAKRFAVIDTENGRASHYADQFAFDVAELRPPFTPAAYAEAIKAADAAGYSVIVVDSASHEYAGEGGVLDMQEAEFERMGGRDNSKMLSWVKPKGEHKKMMQSLLQTKAHLILCFRAEAKIEMVKEDGKVKIVPKQSLIGLDGWIPITEKTVPFELTVSLLLTPDKPGIPHPIKLQEQHRALFPLDQPITEEAGRRIAAWAAGGAVEQRSTDAHAPHDPGVEFITPEQIATIETLCADGNIGLGALKQKCVVTKLSEIKAQDYDRVRKWIDAVIQKRSQTT